MIYCLNERKKKIYVKPSKLLLLLFLDERGRFLNDIVGYKLLTGAHSYKAAHPRQRQRKSNLHTNIYFILITSFTFIRLYVYGASNIGRRLRWGIWHDGDDGFR